VALTTSVRLFRDVIAIASYTPPMSRLLEDAQRVHDVASQSDRMIESAEMIKRLALVVQPESIPVWLQRPILALDDEKPIELIARGEYRRVAKLIAEIEYPGVS
jgi:uncharacterized protein (DUF2384 family)